MALSNLRREHESGSAGDAPRSAQGVEPQPTAAQAARRLSHTGLILGATGIASAIFVIARLLESWRVVSPTASDRISILGLRLSYPTANIEGLVLLLLAGLGAAVTLVLLGGAAQEMRASRRLVRRLSRLKSRTVRGALVLPDPHPRAFCAGLRAPRVYVSSGALAMLDADALDAVLAHERHHVRRRDPLRLAVGRVLARAMFFVPGLPELLERQQAMAELSADESSVAAAADNRAGLARAMLSFSDAGSELGDSGIDPVRVDYLLGESPDWAFPVTLCVSAASVLALVVAAGVLAGRVATGSATLALPFLSAQPCVLVLAAIPALAAVLATASRRRLRAPTPTPTLAQASVAGPVPGAHTT